MIESFGKACKWMRPVDNDQKEGASTESHRSWRNSIKVKLIYSRR